jgi:hypothetical protein
MHIIKQWLSVALTKLYLGWSAPSPRAQMSLPVIGLATITRLGSEKAQDTRKPAGQCCRRIRVHELKPEEGNPTFTPDETHARRTGTPSACSSYSGRTLSRGVDSGKRCNKLGNEVAARCLVKFEKMRNPLSISCWVTSDEGAPSPQITC